MNIRISLLTLRAIVFVCGIVFLLVEGREYFSSKFAGPMPIAVYGVFGIVIISIVFSLSMRQLVAELRARRASAPETPKAVPTAASRAESVHRYPPRLTGMVAGFGLFLVALPFISDALGLATKPITYVCSFSAAAILFAITVRLLLYSVIIKQDRVVVKGLLMREIRFEEMRSVVVETTRNGPQIVVSLNNGKTLRFGRLLTGFRAMTDVLTNVQLNRTHESR